jgi:hypothetical protein
VKLIAAGANGGGPLAVLGAQGVPPSVEAVTDAVEALAPR